TWAANMRRVQVNAAGAAQSTAAASAATAAGTAAASAGAALLLRRFLGVIPVIGSIATLGFLVYDALNLTSSSAEDLSESAHGALDVLEEMPASVSKMRQGLSQNAELMEEFRKSLQQAKADLKETIRTLGLE